MPIRWRLTLYIALVVGAILLLLGLALYSLSRNALLNDVEDTARSHATAAARTLESGESLGDDEDDDRMAFDGVVVIVRGADGRVFETVNLPAEAGAGDAVWREAVVSGEAASGTAVLSGDDPYRVYAVPVDPPGGPAGPARAVEAGAPLEPVEEALAVFGTVLATGIGVAFLLSIGGAYLLARAALRPIEAVTGAAGEMGEGDLRSGCPWRTPGTKWVVSPPP